jgi:hypothetical protein
MQLETLETSVKGRGLRVGEQEIATDGETAHVSGRQGMGDHCRRTAIRWDQCMEEGMEELS